MTSLCLIPPNPHLDLATTRMHMLLAHLCDDPGYAQFYSQRSLLGEYLILDNSAFEFDTAQANMPELLALGYYLQVNEIVAPDVIMHERMTYAHALDSTAFMSTVTGQHAWRRAGSPRIMVVPQVNPSFQGIDSYDRHARILLQTWHWCCPYLAGHITLGVSKNMNKLHGGWLLLFREVIRELVKEFPIQVHALGFPKQLVQIKKVLRENHYIRSLDTALPFVAAMQNMSLQVPDGGLPNRPPNYLATSLTDEQVALANDNISFMMNYFELHPSSALP